MVGNWYIEFNLIKTFWGWQIEACRVSLTVKAEVHLIMRKTSRCRVIYLSFRHVFQQFPFITSISYVCTTQILNISTLNFPQWIFHASPFARLSVRSPPSEVGIFSFIRGVHNNFSSFIVKMRAFWIIKIQFEDYMRNMGASEHNKFSSRSFSSMRSASLWGKIRKKTFFSSFCALHHQSLAADEKFTQNATYLRPGNFCWYRNFFFDHNEHLKLSSATALK